jgi:FKBP-type peptidyl-prolyl cis-trans isomerase FkpA
VNKKVLALLAVVLATAPLYAEESALETEEQKVLYAIGYILSRSLMNYDLTTENLSLVEQGIRDGVHGNPAKVELQEYPPKIEDYLASRRAAVVEAEQTAGTAFRDKVASEAGAQVKDSGLIYVEQQAGDGAAPTESDTVKIHYHGTLRDGSVFDTSRAEGGQPATFALSGVVPCFSEGIRLMRVGGKSKLVCPPEMAYGDRGFPPMIPPGATLLFDVELIEIADGAETAAPAP